MRDAELTYQYSDFGVPGLGLKRGLFEDVVVAPYATALAAMVNPRAALDNFSRLEESGARGAYGFCEALDYTRARLPDQCVNNAPVKRKFRPARSLITWILDRIAQLCVRLVHG